MASSSFTILLSPFVPHICEELWEGLGNSESLYRHPWPEYDEDALVKDMQEIVVQINGKVRERMEVPSGLGRDELLAYCLEQDAVALRAIVVEEGPHDFIRARPVRHAVEHVQDDPVVLPREGNHVVVGRL